MKIVLLLVLLGLTATQALTTGSCSKFSLDGEACEQCVQHYHLFEGTCYVDILGCEQYVMGNICKSCEDNYILVNNLCCDHNCMIKFMKHHESKTLKQTFASNFEVLSKIIPYLNQHYVKEGGHTLVEIQVNHYLDVTRFVILYEFLAGHFSMKRAVVDVKHEGGEIIVADWSSISDKSQFFEFHKEEVSLENRDELKPLLKAAFPANPSVNLAKKIIFTQLTQYQIVVNDEQNERIIYKTLYLWNGAPIHLISEEKSMPAFVASEVVLEGSEQINSYAQKYKHFITVVSFVSSDARYEGEITKVKVNHKARFLFEYEFFITFTKGTMQYYIVEDVKKDTLTIVNYQKQQQEELAPVVEQAVKIITGGEETGQEVSTGTQAIVDIVEGAIEEIAQEHKEDEPKSKCDGTDCSDRVSTESTHGEKDEHKVVTLFRQLNPSIETVEVEKMWSNENFRTFVEWTIAVHYGGRYIFFYAFEDKQTHELRPLGQEESASATLPNPQKNVPEQKVAEARAQVLKEFPETEGLPLQRAIVRIFPNGWREDVVLRHKTETVRYIVLKDNEGIRVVREWDVLEKDLPELNEQVQKETELTQKTEVIVEEITTGKPIEPSVDLTQEKPIEFVVPEIAVEPPIFEIPITVQVTHEVIVEETQVIKESETTNKGKETEHIRTLTPEDEEVVNKVKQSIETITLEETDRQTISQQVPVSVISQKLCDNTDLLLVYDLGDRAVSFAFRMLVTDASAVQYLGRREIAKTPGMTDKKMLDALTAISVEYTAAEAEQVVASTYDNYREVKADQVIANQLGEELRFLVIYQEGGFVNRFFLSGPLSSRSYKVIEECRVEEKRDNRTTTTVSVTGEKSVETTEVETLVKEDEVAQQVVDFVTGEKGLEEFNKTAVKTTEYENSVEYEVEFEKVIPATEKQPETVERVEETVVHNKETHENTIVGEKKSNGTHEQLEQQKEQKEEKEHVAVVVTEEEKERMPEQEKAAIEEVLKEAHEKHNLPEEEYEVVEVIVQEKGETVKVQEVLQKKDGSEEVLVTAIVDEKTGKHVVEEVKVVDETVVEHLKPVEVTETVEKPAPVEEKPAPTEEITVTVIPSEVEEIIIKVEEAIKKEISEVTKPVCSEQGTETTQQPTEETPEETTTVVEQIVQVEISPGDIQNVAKEVLENPEEKTTTEPTPAITLTTSEALLYLHSVKGETEKATLEESTEKQFDNAASVTLKLIFENTEYNAIVTKTAEGISLAYFDEATSQGETSVGEVVKELEEKDTADFKPIDPNNVYYIKASSILKSQPLQEFEKEVNLDEISQIITEATLTIRNNYPIVKDAGIIRILEIFSTSNIKQYTIYFYVAGEGDQYTVYGVTVEYNSQASEPVYKVLTVKLVIENGKLVNKVLEQDGENQQARINIAYGFEDVNLAEASHDLALKDIQGEIESKYADLIAGQTISSIERLELKNGKINYVIKYQNVYFTVYYDQILMRTVLLNAVTSLNNQQYTPVTNPQNDAYYKACLQHLIGQHTAELKDYKVISSGMINNGTHFIYQIEFFSQGHKYRGVINMHRELLDIAEVSWNEILEVDLKHINFMELYVEQYHRLAGSELKSNNYFAMVDSYSRHRNSILAGALILGVGYKPQNLGFNYRVFYKLTNSLIVAVEVYIETFTEKINQLSLSYLDFVGNFVQIKPEGSEVNEIIQVLANKASIDLTQGTHVIQNIEAKDFLFGNLYHVTLEYNSILFEGLLYHDHTTQEANLISWLPVRNSQACEIWEVQDSKCQKCSQGYYLNENKICRKETVGCQKYAVDQETCGECSSGYTLTNNLCVKDCGALCLALTQ